MKNIEARELYQRLLAGENLLLLDIREDEEVRFCKIPDSKHIPMYHLPERLQELDPDQMIVVYCHSGVRSIYVCQFLERNGFHNVQNLRGGITEWSLQVDPTVPIY